MKLKIVVLFFILSKTVFSQGISAEYDCSLAYPNGVTLNYTGKYYYQGNKSISYMLPDYLSKYPDGTVKVKGVDYAYSFDSVQFITLIDLDSGTYKASFNFSIYEGRINASGGEWQITNETAEIGGYQCKHAYWVMNNGKDTSSEIWYTNEIPCPTGFAIWTYVPGFVVKVKTPMNLTAVLRKVQVGVTLPPEIFIREELRKRKR